MLTYRRQAHERCNPVWFHRCWNAELLADKYGRTRSVEILRHGCRSGARAQRRVVLPHNLPEPSVGRPVQRCWGTPAAAGAATRVVVLSPSLAPSQARTRQSRGDMMRWSASIAGPSSQSSSVAVQDGIETSLSAVTWRCCLRLAFRSRWRGWRAASEKPARPSAAAPKMFSL